MNTYQVKERLSKCYPLAKRQLIARFGALFLTFLLGSCSHGDVTCDVAGPTQDLSINLSFNGNTTNTACNQASQTKPITSNGVTLTTDRTGIKNGASQFNGTNSVIYIDSLSYGPNVTMSCWIKADNFNQAAVVLYYGNPNSNGFGLVMGGGGCIKGNKMTVLIGGVTCDLGYSSGVIADASWYHVALVKQDKTFTLFVNGLTKLTTDSFFYEPTKRLNIGAHLFAANNNGYFSGAIDDVRVYDRALTTDEITVLSKLN